MKFANVYFGAIIFLAAIYACYEWIDRKGWRDKFNRQVGTYIIDLTETNLASYSRDSLKYKNLRLTFRADSTFHLNMKAPFIFDSSGVWSVPGGMSSEWNYLYYNKNKRIATQFSNMLTNDSTFYLNSVTPQEDSLPVNQISFRKIKE